ncbi:MAG: hypothetical protein FWG83_00335 [Oscillospiraceae bacterium]|nr:hypothetical protein [Oscillospiraceae bacterium]
MKLRKILSLVVAIVMISTLAISAGAVWTVPIESAPSGYDVQFHVAGSSVRPRTDAINYELIRGVRWTFELTETDYGVDENGVPGDFVVVSAGWNCGPTGWQQQDFNYPAQKSYTVDLSQHAWVPAPEGQEGGTGIDWLEVSAAVFSDLTCKGTVKIEILGPNNVVLSRGQQELATTSTGTTATGNTNNSELKTGVDGVAILGGVAILAAGAVIVTGKRRKSR